MTVSLKSQDEIEKMRVAGRLASEVLDYITPFVKPGVTTDELDNVFHRRTWYPGTPPVRSNL